MPSSYLLRLVTMATKRQRTVTEENRKFNNEWTGKYLFTSVNNKAVCLICQNSIAQNKEYNIKRHFEKNHGEKYGKYTIEERKQLSDKLARGLQAQQQVLTRTSTTDFDNTAVSFKIARVLGKHQKPFSDGEIVKECLMAFVES